MEPGDWIAVGAGGVAVIAMLISLSQAKSARTAATQAERQAAAAEDQANLLRQQLAQATQAHREQNEPYVVVDIQPDQPGSGLMVLLIENIGPTVARNVQVTVTPPLESGLGDTHTQRLQRAMGRTFPMLPPGRRLKYVFDVPDRFSNTALPQVYDFTVRAEGPYGPVEDLAYTVDFGTWGESLVGERPMKRLEQKVADVASSLKKLADHYGKANATSIRTEQEQRVARLRQRAPGDGTPAGDGTNP